jgi:hypothetical protein
MMIELCIMAVAVLLTMLGYAVLCWIGGNNDD